MRAAGEIRRHAIFQRRARRRDRAADRSPRAFDHRFGPRKADAPLDFARQRAGGDAIEIGLGVDEREVGPLGGGRLDQAIGRDDAFGDHPLAEQPVFRHRKPMFGRQREDEMIAVERPHRK